MTAPRLGQGMPTDDSWMARQLADLQRQITELRAARTLDAAQVGSGGVTITDDGSLTVIDQSSGRTVAFLGKALTVDGARQMVAEFYRDDGTIALALGDFGTVAGHLHLQALQWFDRAGNVVVSDDTNGGMGLARPFVCGIQFQNTNTGTWPSTTNGTWTTIATGFHLVQNPRLQWSLWMNAAAATTGQFRVTVNGTQVSTTQTVTAGFLTWSAVNVALPGGLTPGTLVTVNVDAQVTAGAGAAKAVVVQFQGDQSP